MKLNRLLIKDVLSYGVLGVLSRLISIITVPIYAAYLSPSGIGIIEAVGMSVAVLGLISLCQVETAYLQLFYDPANATRKAVLFSTAFTFTLLASSLMSILLLGIKVLATKFDFLSDIHVNQVLVYTAVQIPLLNTIGFGSVYFRAERKKQAFVIFNLMLVIFTATSGIISLKYTNMGLHGVLISNTAVMAAFSVLMTYICRSQLKPSFDVFLLKHMLRIGFPLLPSSIGIYLQQYLARVIILSYWGLSELGIYSIAAKIASPLMLVTGAIKVSWAPIAFGAQTDPDAGNQFSAVLNKYIIIGGFILIALSLLSNQIIKILFDLTYSNSNALVPLIACTFYLKGLQAIYSPALAIKRKNSLVSLSTVVGIITTLCALLLLVESKNGALMVAYSALAGEIISSIFITRFVNKHFVGYFNRMMMIGAIAVPIVVGAVNYIATIY